MPSAATATIRAARGQSEESCAPVPTPPPGLPGPPRAQPRREPARRRTPGAGISVLCSEGLLACLHPALGQALAIADITVPLAVALTLLAAILFGSSQTVERVFRLLRWIADRPEPPGPGRA